MKRVSILILLITVFITVMACGKETKNKDIGRITEIQRQEEMEYKDQKDVLSDGKENTDENSKEEENWKLVSGTDYCNNIAIAVEENEVDGEKRVVAIDQMERDCLFYRKKVKHQRKLILLKKQSLAEIWHKVWGEMNA